jgi:hypothetical protein
MSKKKSYETLISFPEFGKIVIMMHKSDDPKMSKENVVPTIEKHLDRALEIVADGLILRTTDKGKIGSLICCKPSCKKSKLSRLVDSKARKAFNFYLVFIFIKLELIS